MFFFLNCYQINDGKIICKIILVSYDIKDYIKNLWEFCWNWPWKTWKPRGILCLKSGGHPDTYTCMHVYTHRHACLHMYMHACLYMYRHACMHVHIYMHTYINACMHKVGVYQASVLSLLLFIIVLEALSREFRSGLPLELPHIVLVAESIEELEILIDRWKCEKEQNSGNTKVMISRYDLPQNKFPYGVYQKGAGRNSIVPTYKWSVHAKCSGAKDNLVKATVCTYDVMVTNLHLG